MSETMKLPDGVSARTVYLARDEREFSSVRDAVEYNEDLARAEAATAALESGATVYDAAVISSRFKQHPPHEALKRITASTPLIISYWQCRDNPGYRVGRFLPDGDVYVSGDAGGYSGPYGSSVTIRDLVRYVEDTLRKHPELEATHAQPAEG